jgi:hypothetical protein
MSAPGRGNGSNGNDRRALLERRAAMVRERIEQRLEVLEHRRDGLVRRVQSITKPPIAVVAVVAIGVIGAALLLRRARRRRQAGLEWMGRPQPRRGWLARSFERAAISLGAAALHRVGVLGLDSALGPAHRAPVLPLPPRPNGPRLPRV